MTEQLRTTVAKWFFIINGLHTKEVSQWSARTVATNAIVRIFILQSGKELAAWLRWCSGRGAAS